MRPKRSVRDAPVRGKRVLVRVDFNVPLTPQGNVADPRRIVSALPTLQHLQAAGARVILLSHLGRPDGQRDARLSLRPVARKLSELIGMRVPLAEDCVGISAINATVRLKNGEFLLLENLRFHAGEEANDPAFVSELVQLGELFVEDAFGTVHRAHASTVGVPKRLPGYAGFLVERETRELSRLVDQVEHPYTTVLGGAKVADKLPLLESLPGRADQILIGGALAVPFLGKGAARRGAPPTDSKLVQGVQDFLQHARQARTVVGLPEDLVVEEEGSGGAKTVPADRVPSGWSARDIGPATRSKFSEALKQARTVFWNGPLGKAEDPRFADGTREVIGSLVGREGYRVCAGGDTANVADALGLSPVFQFISTGGGAALEFVQGLDLPGLAVLPDA
jgi:3-phosphoglycerate kinase